MNARALGFEMEMGDGNVSVIAQAVVEVLSDKSHWRVKPLSFKIN